MLNQSDGVKKIRKLHQFLALKTLVTFNTRILGTLAELPHWLVEVVPTKGILDKHLLLIVIELSFLRN